MKAHEFVEVHGSPQMTPEQFRARAARLRDDQRRKTRAVLFTAVAAASPAAPPASRPATPAGVAVLPQQPASGRRRRPEAGRDPLQLQLPGRIGSLPPANRGGELTAPHDRGLFSPEITTRCHWLTVTFPAENLDAVRERVSRDLKNQAEDRLRGMWGYEAGCQWDEKALLSWTVGRPEACLDLNGDSMDQLDHAQQLALIQFLRQLAAEATRVDVALDDYERTATLDDVHAAADAGNFAGFRLHMAMTQKNLDGKRLSDSHTFGRRGKAGALKYLRIYDKFLETGGHPDFDCVRWEVENRKERAHEVFAQLADCSSADAYARRLGQLVVEAVDFVDRSSVAAGSASHLDRLERLGWWSALVRKVTQGPIIRVVRVVPTLVSAAQTMQRQWSKLLALLDSQLQPIGSSAASVVQFWVNKARDSVDVARAARQRDLSVSLTLLCG